MQVVTTVRMSQCMYANVLSTYSVSSITDDSRLLNSGEIETDAFCGREAFKGLN